MLHSVGVGAKHTHFSIVLSNSGKLTAPLLHSKNFTSYKHDLHEVIIYMIKSLLILSSALSIAPYIMVIKRTENAMSHACSYNVHCKFPNCTSSYIIIILLWEEYSSIMLDPTCIYSYYYYVRSNNMHLITVSMTFTCDLLFLAYCWLEVPPFL